MGNRNGDALYVAPQDYGTKGKSMGKSKVMASKSLVGGGAKGGPTGQVGKQGGTGQARPGTGSPNVKSMGQGKSGKWGVKAGPSGKVGKQGGAGKSKGGTGYGGQT